MQPKDIRLQKLRELLKEHGDNKASLARTLGKAPAQISQWFNGVRTITEESARQIETKAKRPVGWLDTFDYLPTAPAVPIRSAEPQATFSAWPFSTIEPAAYFAVLSQGQRDRIEAFAAGVLSEASTHAQKKHGGHR